MRKMLKMLSWILIIQYLLVTGATAIEPSILLASEYLSSYYAYINAEGSGIFAIYFEVTGTGTMDEIGALTIILQEYSNGSWQTVKTYEYTAYPNMLAYNRPFYGSHVSYSGKSGYSYRAYVTVWAGKNGLGDSRQLFAGTAVA